jgi:hypothetical protein
VSGRVRQHDIRGHGVVALTEHRGRNLEGFADHRLGGPSAAVDQRAYIENGNATNQRVHGIT